MAKGLLGGTTDYSHQSLPDIMNDLTAEIKNAEAFVNIIQSNIDKLAENRYWNSTVPSDFKEIINYALRHYRTAIGEFADIRNDLKSHVKEHHIKRLEKISSVAREINIDIGKVWHNQYFNKNYGVANFKIVERIYGDTRDMAVNLLDASNMAGRLKDFVGREVQQPQKKKFKLELGHYLAICSLLVGIVVLLYGENLIGRRQSGAADSLKTDTSYQHPGSVRNNDSSNESKPGFSRKKSYPAITEIATKNPSEKNHTQLISKSDSVSIQKVHGITNDAMENTLDGLINNVPAETDMAVLIVDNNNQAVNGISSDITNLYRGKGHLVTNSLFTNKLLSSKCLGELMNSNSQLITRLNLPSHLKYIVVGKYSKSFRNSDGDNVKVVCDADLDIRVIGCATKSQIDGFEISESFGHNDNQHAEKGVIMKIVSNFSVNHLNL